MNPYRTVTLEISAKPFGLHGFDPAAAERTAAIMLRQWDALLRHAEAVRVLLWTSDGSEILAYAGDPDAVLDWACWIGGANRHAAPTPADPRGEGLHARCYPYIPAPPAMTYRQLAGLVTAIRRAGEALGMPLAIGTAFDPGPEFAKSPFKYAWHPEICLADTMGEKTFACCYARLAGDARRYAAFPAGIPDGLPFATFLGRQARRFCADLGFDWLWLSNGFGYGLETWGVRGAVFDGSRFRAERRHDCRERVLEFWRLLRAELPGLPIATRGTNLMTGTDIAGDGQPLAGIYRGGFAIEPPPNSPWAAIDGDVGLELAGWMSHIAELPPDSPALPFRFYAHDPWWLNSPWLDRYGREAYDIWLPGAVARLDGAGATQLPDRLAILTVDDALGAMPQQVPDEVIPHLLECRRHAPDEAGPLVWAYPFDEHHARAFGADADLAGPWAADWQVRGAIDEGLPLNTVVSTGNLARILAHARGRLADRIIVAAVPQPGADGWLRSWLDGGGRCLLHGPLATAPAWLRQRLGLSLAEALAGAARVELSIDDDPCREAVPDAVQVRPLLNGGGCAEVAAGARELAALRFADGRRCLAAEADGLLWVRGINGVAYHGGLLPHPDPLSEAWPCERLMRLVLARFGWSIRLERDRLLPPPRPGRRPGVGPVLTVHRSGNGLWFAGLMRSPHERLRLRTPAGAPLLLGVEAHLQDGHACYHLPRAWRRECRVLVDQAAAGPVLCDEITHERFGARRRLWVSGLIAATVTILPEAGSHAEVLRDPPGPFLVGAPLDCRAAEDGSRLICRDVTGQLCITW